MRNQLLQANQGLTIRLYARSKRQSQMADDLLFAIAQRQGPVKTGGRQRLGELPLTGAKTG